MSHRAFEKLKTLEDLHQWHEEAYKIFGQWRKELSQLELDEDFLKMPKVIWLSEYLKDIIDSANKELTEKRELSDRDRDRIFNLRDIAEVIYKSFSKEELNNKVSIIERDIDEELKKYGN